MRLVRAELQAMLVGRRIWWALAVAVIGSALGGLVSGSLALHFEGMTDVESATVAVSRGSAAQLAIVVLISLTVAGQYRDGAWMHAALAVPSPGRRLAVSAAATLLVSIALGLVSIVVATSVAVPFVSIALPAVAVAAAIHIAAAGLWGLWALGLAHASRSPLAVLAVGIGVPFVAEPAIAGATTATDLPELQWLLPGHALRAFAERPVSDGLVLAAVGDGAVALATAGVVGWSLGALALAWLRIGGRQPH